MEKKNKPATFEIVGFILGVLGGIIIILECIFAGCSDIKGSADTGINNLYNARNATYTLFSGSNVALRNNSRNQYATHTIPYSFYANNAHVGDEATDVNTTNSVVALLGEQRINYTCGAYDVNVEFVNLFAGLYYPNSISPTYYSPDLSITNDEVRVLLYDDYVALLQNANNIRFTAYDAWSDVETPLNYVRAGVLLEQDFYNATTKTFDRVELSKVNELSLYDTHAYIPENIADTIYQYSYVLKNTEQRVIVLGRTTFNAFFYRVSGGAFDENTLTRPAIQINLQNLDKHRVNVDSVNSVQNAFSLEQVVYWNGQTGLFDFVETFLTTEWFDGFSFSTLLVIMFGCLLVGAVLKIFLGG